MNFFHSQETKKEGGFILLLSMLVISIILAISFGIYSLSIKQVILASFLKNSQQAFVAADRAIECALYWDVSYPQNGFPYTVFATSTLWVQPASFNSFVCDGRVVPTLPSFNNTVPARTPTSGRTTYSIAFSDSTCADVIVDKLNDFTTVTANGYNTCDTANTRRTQRTIQVKTGF